MLQLDEQHEEYLFFNGLLQFKHCCFVPPILAIRFWKSSLFFLAAQERLQYFGFLVGLEQYRQVLIFEPPWI